MKKLLMLMIAALLTLNACTSEGGTDINTEITAETGAVITNAESSAAKNETDTAFISEASAGGIPVMRFVAATDVHIKDYDSIERTRFADLFKDTYAYCETQAYKNLDAVVISGDFTDNGTTKQYEAFSGIIKDHIREETQPIVLMGNHEWGNSNYDDFAKKMGMEPNSDNIIKGFHFIGLSPVGSDYSSQFDWVGQHLKAASGEDPKKPIFTFQHHHMRDTVYVSEEWYTDQLDDIYDDYSQSVNFSGHSHGPVNNPRSIYQKDYTLLGAGTLSYFECLSGMSYGTIPPDAGQAAQFFIVEVYADNSVKLMPFNLLTHDFFRETDSYSDENIVWYIDTPSDKSTFRYTDARYKTADNPVFPVGTPDAVISDIGTKTAVVTFTQAKDGECVCSYEIALYAAGAETASSVFNIFSEYYFEPMPETLSYTVGGLRGNTEYAVKITAVDCFGKRSKNFISGSFKTKEAVPFKVNAGSGGTFKGTFTDFEGYKSFTEGDNQVYNGSADGDYWVGAWDSGSRISGSGAQIIESKGYNGSKALALWENGMENQGLYLYANSTNNNLNSFKGAKYLRVWMDLSSLDFRKANFGVFDYDGNLFTTDECDGYSGLYFWYLPDGDDKWEQYEHGSDGCFGSDQDSSVAGFRGWFAFPVSDFTIRANANPGGYAAGESYDLSEVNGIYMFWDYDDSIEQGTKFYLDEIALVEDHTVFKK
ncbi:MAG: metallophosphoesterase [Eubacteriales bacterium]